MPDQPSGTVTFLFTDIVGSTRLWREHHDAMSSALERHDALCRARFAKGDGYVFATGGDGFAVAFARASDALTAAMGLQADLAAEPWPAHVALRVRMALHTGEAVQRGGDYFGPAVNTAARLLAVGHGDQILVSSSTRQIVEDDLLSSLGPHRLKDLAAPIDVWQVGQLEFGPLLTNDAAPDNLPVQLSRLVGRDQDLAQVTEAVRAHRLVTLTGVGGVGKTRLALAVAAAMKGDFRDGCWLVDLSSREATDDLAAAVARSTGAEAAETDRRMLMEHLRDRQMLLVVDNCEHLIESIADLVDDLLTHSSAVRVIATSREPLGVDGEHIIRVNSLAVPEAEINDDDPTSAPAVALFLERAHEAGGLVDDDPDNVAAIAAICRHLDGIPLAIELAAARTRGMAPVEILDRIGERFRLLGGGRRSRERHHTMIATVNWSHELLSTDEQIVWRRLSVFVGGFDLDAAEAVVGHADTLETLLSLVDKSMVQVDHAAGRSRHKMLETLRQFAADRLVDADEVDEIRARHAAHFLDRIRAGAASLRGPDETVCRQVAVIERDNVVAAAEHLREVGRLAEVAEHLSASEPFWMIIAPADGFRIAQALADAVDSDELAVRLLGLAAFCAWESGDLESALQLGREHLVRSETASLPPRALGLAALLIAVSLGWSDDAEELIEAAIAAVEREGDDYLGAIVHGLASRYRCDIGDPSWRDGVSEAERSRDRLRSGSAAVSVALTTAASELTKHGDGPSAAAEVLRSVEGLAPDAVPSGRAWFHVMLGDTLVLRAGEDDRAAGLEHLRHAVRLADRLGSAIVRNLGVEGIALVRALDGRVSDAALARGHTRFFFDANGLHRGGVGERVRAVLDGLIDGHLDRQGRADADARALTLSQPDLLRLVLSD